MEVRQEAAIVIRASESFINSRRWNSRIGLMNSIEDYVDLGISQRQLIAET